ncbi:hypothetical protein [Nitratireductor basaltis]|uniref:hypothetical protein n=1 Tax=Nitratireductor basaltis TaxID=472175 RepID=UPI001268D060|nr:hypothetical protein [Nitratireductor basaltis]
MIEKIEASSGRERNREVDEFLQGLWDRAGDEIDDESFMVEIGNVTYQKPAPFTDDLHCAMALAVRLLDDGPIDIEVAHRTIGCERIGRADICGPKDDVRCNGATPTLALLLAVLCAHQMRTQRPVKVRA